MVKKIVNVIPMEPHSETVKSLIFQKRSSRLPEVVIAMLNQ